MRRLLFRLALLAYPRGFRRRFGEELLRDLRAPGTSGTFGTLGTLIASGLAERWSAVVRWFWWPTHHAHLYEPSGRHHMFWDSLRSDLRHTLRLAARTPLVTALTVGALALGIGATTAIFAVVHGVLVKPLPYASSDRLVVVWSDATPLGRPENTMSPANYRDFAAMNQTLQGLEAYFSFVTPLEMTIDTGATEVAMGVAVTRGLFDLLGRAPLIGRTFDADASSFDVVLSHGFWQRRFGGDPAVIGRAIQVGTVPATIAGVMPADFTFPYGTMLGPSGFTRVTSVDLWAPISFEGPLAAANRMLDARGELVRNVHWLGAIGRMKPGVGVEHVQADLSTVARQLELAHPQTNKGWGATVVPLLEQTVGTLRAPLLVLLTGVAFVLIIAAVNVANLVLARSIARQRELATRVALGAGRRRLVQQALTEGLLLAAAGGLAGLALSWWGVAGLIALAPPALPRLDEVTTDPAALLVALGASVVTGLFVGLLPALSAAGVAPHAALQENSRGSIGARSRHRIRAVLVVAEVALAVTLVIGAGLLLRSFSALMAVDAGFEPQNLLTWQMNLPDRRRQPAERDAFYDEFLTRMRALPGVVSVGGTSRLPLASTELTTTLDIDGRGLPRAEWPEVQFRRSVGDYFQTMGIPLIAGRVFDAGDQRQGRPVAIVNDVLARRLFPGETAVGRQVRMAEDQPWITIVGVVGAIKHSALDEDPQPELYMNDRQGSLVSPFIVLRTRGPAEDLIEMVRAEARAIDPHLPVYDLKTMEALRAESLGQRRFVLALVGLFGALALTLAALGVYGVMSLLVSERTQEVGVRLALGANPADVVRMLVTQAARLAAAGVVLGVALAALITPLLRSQLYQVDARDPLTMAGVPAVLMTVAVLAAIVPARRAMRVDPVKALRYE